MQISRNDWTPLFQGLKERLSSEYRQVLTRSIGSLIFNSTMSNFGGEGAAGDMRPWNNELLVSKEYAEIIGRDFATLNRTDEERSLCHGTNWGGGISGHLKDSFTLSFDSDSTVLKNSSEYASFHQKGTGNVPRRPFFPIDENNELADFMVERINKTVENYFTISFEHF